jgi:hypothetical protein
VKSSFVVTLAFGASRPDDLVMNRAAPAPRTPRRNWISAALRRANSRWPVFWEKSGGIELAAADVLDFPRPAPCSSKHWSAARPWSPFTCPRRTQPITARSCGRSAARRRTDVGDHLGEYVAVPTRSSARHAGAILPRQKMRWPRSCATAHNRDALSKLSADRRIRRAVVE